MHEFMKMNIIFPYQSEIIFPLTLSLPSSCGHIPFLHSKKDFLLGKSGVYFLALDIGYAISVSSYDPTPYLG